GPPGRGAARGLVPHPRSYVHSLTSIAFLPKRGPKNRSVTSSQCPSVHVFRVLIPRGGGPLDPRARTRLKPPLILIFVLRLLQVLWTSWTSWTVVRNEYDSGPVGPLVQSFWAKKRSSWPSGPVDLAMDH